MKDAFADLDEVGTDPLFDLVQCAVGKLLAANDPEDLFYTHLWSFVAESNLLTSRDEHIFALATVLIDERLPYYRFDLVSMGDEEYGSLMQELVSDIGLLHQISARPFPQRTEEASAYLSVLHRHNGDARRQALLMSVLADILRNQD